MCDHRLLDDPAGLVCTRPDCDGRGHTYESTSWPLDRHGEEPAQ